MTSRPDFAAFDLNPERIGGSFDAWLAEEGFAEEVHEQAVKALLAEQIIHAMKQQGMTKRAFAAALQTSRSQLDRILDPKDDGVTLATVKRAAAVVGMRLRLELVSID